MTRPIKFRGRVSDPTRRDVDQFIFGDLIHGPVAECALKIKPPGRRAVDVYQDTIAQLVGYDKDGREVFEGDEVVDNIGRVFTAYLGKLVRTDKGFFPDISLNSVSLKEAINEKTD